MMLPSLFPLPANRVWRTYRGGRELDRRQRIHPPRDDHFPEDWLGSMTTAVNPGRKGESRAGQSWVDMAGERRWLADLFREHPTHFFSREHLAAFGSQPEILVKLLDAAERLQLQVHPTREFARRVLGKPYGKTEAYYIVSTRPEVADPFIYLGFRRPVSPADFRVAVEKQDSDEILDALAKVSVRTGDVFIVPGGLPHAIGGGIMMVEVMEPSDLVVRFEFQQPGGYVLPESARFMGRDLNFALRMIDFTAYSPTEIRRRFFCAPRVIQQEGTSTISVLIDRAHTPCFRLNLISVDEPFTCEGDEFGIGIVVGGHGQLERGGQEFEIDLGSTFLIPHAGGRLRFTSPSRMDVLWVLPPDPTLV